MADHARHAQAALRHHAVRVVVAAVEVGVGDDGAPRHLVERDVLRRQVRRRRHRDAVAHALGMAQRPRQRLHAAQAAADHRGELLDAQRVDQARLRIDPVLDRDHRKVGAVRAGRWPGSACIGPVEPKHEPRLLTPMTKKRSVSSGLPGPTRLSHQPSLLVLPVVACRPRGARRSAHGTPAPRCSRSRVERAVGLVDQRVVGAAARRWAAAAARRSAATAA